MPHQASCIISNPSMNSNWSYSPETPNSESKSVGFFVPCDLEIWRTTLKNDKAPLLYYIKLCTSCQNHEWIQTGVTIWKRSIWVKITIFWSLKFDGWPWKTIGHLFYAISSFVHDFITIHEFKLELRSGNGYIGLWSVTLTFDLWRWPFAWTSHLSLVITPDNFTMIQWWKHSENGVTVGWTDRLNHSSSCLVAVKNVVHLNHWIVECQQQIYPSVRHRQKAEVFLSWMIFESYLFKFQNVYPEQFNPPTSQRLFTLPCINVHGFANQLLIRNSGCRCRLSGRTSKCSVDVFKSRNHWLCAQENASQN